MHKTGASRVVLPNVSSSASSPLRPGRFSLIFAVTDTNSYELPWLGYANQQKVVFPSVTSCRSVLMIGCLGTPIDKSTHRHFVTCRLDNFSADEGLDQRRSFRISLMPDEYPFAALWKCQEVIALYMRCQYRPPVPCFEPTLMPTVTQLTSTVFRTLEKKARSGTLDDRREYLVKQGGSFLFLESPQPAYFARIRVPVVMICAHVLTSQDEGVLACFEPTSSPEWNGNVTVALTMAKPNTDTTGESLTSVCELNTCSACLKVADMYMTTATIACLSSSLDSPLSR